MDIHAQAVRESATITKVQWRLMKKRAAAKVELLPILKSLRRKRIPFVLTGAHAIGGWTGEPRSTKYVDILVSAGLNHARAVRAIRRLYPTLEVRDFAGVTAFFVPGERNSVIDITYPHRADIEETLASRLWVEDRGVRYRIPFLEAALANKYGAMLTPTRPAGKRQQDAADFTKMVVHSTDKGQRPIDLDKLRALGEKVWPDGGGAEIIKLAQQIIQGRFVDLNTLLSEKTK